jgi:hypothetical protein
MPSFTYDALGINEELDKREAQPIPLDCTQVHSNRTCFPHFAVENTGQRFTDMSRAYGERGGSFIDETVVLEQLGRGNHFGSAVNDEESDRKALCRRT